MKIVHVPRRFTQDSWGGTETCILELAKAQRQLGHQADIVTSKALCRDEHEIIDGVPVERHNYSYPYMGLSAEVRDAMDQSGGNLISASLFKRLLIRPDIDVFHLHTGKRLGGLVRTVARIHNAPYLVSLHGGVFDVPVHYQAGQSVQAQTGMEWGKVIGAMTGARSVLRDADAVICVSNAEAEKAQAHLPNTRVEYLPNGVDCQAYRQGDGTKFRTAYGIPNDHQIILQVGRIDPQKNQLLLLEAMSGMDPASKIHLVLIGHVTDSGYHKQLSQRVSELGLSDKVTLISGLPPQDPMLLSAYKAASLFCLPSVHEPFGIVVLEAWAAGVPVIASAVGGLRDLIRDGLNGVLLPHDSSEAWRTNIQSLLAEPAKTRQLAQNAKVEVEQQFDWKVVNQRLMNLYQELLDEKQTRQRFFLRRAS